ncbi:MAG: hypothetical protein A2Y62_22125 [Candidatus Fischerbacteria bacterium RBG_13_37_8]|uniref:Uncharacterized protein n=1 Tax=Candidatus Fischerbacteria bacterium RBG_13_37_8 TaxID=1817863 RepID=A0A1F5VX63_9BACT|nr:MAG: hypothetical protein A2Y62_22125 [Candidatus Fischerbacteria bacterium RBG_13_37_8]
MYRSTIQTNSLRVLRSGTKQSRRVRHCEFAGGKRNNPERTIRSIVRYGLLRPAGAGLIMTKSHGLPRTPSVRSQKSF